MQTTDFLLLSFSILFQPPVHRAPFEPMRPKCDVRLHPLDRLLESLYVPENITRLFRTLRVDDTLQHLADLLDVVPRQFELLVIRPFQVGPGPAAIFGRGSLRACNADRINLSCLHTPHRLQTNLVLPRVAEVVLVKKPLVGPEVKIRQTDLAGIGPKGRATRPTYFVLLASDHKPVEVRVGPMEGSLEGVTKIGDRGLASSQNPSPHRRVDPSQQKVELIDFGRVPLSSTMAQAYQPRRSLSAPGFSWSPSGGQY